MRIGKLAILAVTTLVAALLIGSLALQMQAEAASVKTSTPTPTTTHYGLVKQGTIGYSEAHFRKHIPLPPIFQPPELSEANFTITAEGEARNINRWARNQTIPVTLSLAGTFRFWRNIILPQADEADKEIGIPRIWYKLGTLRVEVGQLSVGDKTYSVESGLGVYHTKTKYGLLIIQIRVIDEASKRYLAVLQGRVVSTEDEGVYNVSFKAQTVRLAEVYLLKLDGTLQTTTTLRAYSIRTLGGTWDHTTITIKVEESPLAANYTDAVIKAIKTWNDTLRTFASHSEYSYLSNVTLKLTNSDDADVKIRFTDEGRFKIGGETLPSFKEDKIFKNIAVTVRVGPGYTHEIVYAVTLHELGHALGLGHTNIPEDLMYPVLTGWALRSVGISTLDLYGVAQIFGWLPNNSLEGFKVPSVVTLPASIPYEVVEGS